MAVVQQSRATAVAPGQLHHAETQPTPLVQPGTPQTFYDRYTV